MADLNQQLDLFAPDRWPRRPYCTDDYEEGQDIRSLAKAIEKKYIQPNPPNVRIRSIFDIDHDGGAAAWLDELPAPNWTCSNQDNPRAHLSYEWEVPALLADPAGAAMRSARYLAGIESLMMSRLGSDVSYSGVLVKNPARTDCWRVKHWTPDPYTFREIAEYLPGLDRHIPKTSTWNPALANGASRNCTLFGWLGPEGRWAYREVRRYWGGSYEAWESRVMAVACERNGQFKHPLGINEVMHIAKSVAYWCWSRFTPGKFSEYQAAQGLRRQQKEMSLVGMEAYRESRKERGALGGKRKGQKNEFIRRRAQRMATEGTKQQVIAAELGVNQATVSRWLKNMQ